MKKLHVLLLVALSTSLLLFGCGKKDDAQEPANVEDITLENEAGADGPASGDTETEAETEESREGMVRSTLTNEWIDESIANNRPIAVMFPHDKTAMPQQGIADADILYEIYAQSTEPRMLGVIKDWHNMEKIGNIRSCRDYYVYLALEWDALYVHYGLVYYADDILARSDVNHIDGCGRDGGAFPANAPNAFYRISDKKAPHNVYTSGELLQEACSDLGFDLEYRKDYYYPEHYKFADEKSPNTLADVKGSFDATKIDMSKAFGVDKPTLEYNESDGLYYRTMYGNPHKDANGKQLAFANIIVQNTYAEARDPHKYWYYQVHDDTRDGYYFTQGKGIHVTWKKSENYEPTKYYDDDGNEVVFNTGKTMIFIVQDGQEFDYQ
ncbi:MAG: DUF3048 domain-containing protein [Clostridiales bacterium]|nr:DUF3048 domain-containing protein [Clostridiales bacterium]